MNITFKNNSTSAKMIIAVQNQKYTINPGAQEDVFCNGTKTEFVAQTAFFDELTDGITELEKEIPEYSLKDRILAKLSKRFAEKLPEMVLIASVKYKISCGAFQNAVVNLTEGTYSVCDGKLADFLDMMPVGYMFARAETENGQLNTVDVNVTNRKKYLRLMRNILLFMNWGLFLVELFWFIPEYIIIKYYSSHFYIRKLFAGLYKLPFDKREKKLADKEKRYEKEEKSGCLSGLIKGIIVLLAFVGVCLWATGSGPEVIISEDLQSVAYFDEVFVRVDGKLPDDAKKAFAEDYIAYYPLPGGEYDSENYYCYIYEDSDGERYMWLKNDCSKEENADKNYDDYENPMVYKAVEEEK